MPVVIDLLTLIDHNRHYQNANTQVMVEYMINLHVPSERPDSDYTGCVGSRRN